ncbi:MAG: ATP-binding cassette domain-containing protein, partial [Verrucomicrobia bacterium]|nr:ATP-binding cassette domain-containing protein [Verrucomicrobiota bacterium]
SLNAAKDKVVEAAKRAHAHEFIVDLPEGYHTVIGDRGVKLSGGERQRLALARSILRDPQILILDEATSDLDSKSEQLIQDSLREMSWNRTVIVIAHRLSTIENADEIIVIEDGRVVEKGNHQMLLQAGGYYAQYYELQFWKGMQAKRAEGETLCEDD